MLSDDDIRLSDPADILDWLEHMRTVEHWVYADKAARAADEIKRLRAQLTGTCRSKVSRAVVGFLAERGEGTVQQIKARVRSELPDATEREVHNTLSMLTRDKRVRRLGYGRYAAA